MEKETEEVEDLFAGVLVDEPTVNEEQPNSDLSEENTVELVDSNTELEQLNENYVENSVDDSNNTIDGFKEVTPSEASLKLDEKNGTQAKEVLENPNAKVTLQTEKDEVITNEEIEELKNVKLKDNKSLIFIIILGLILLVIIFLIPFITNLF